jgi:hypothetical protein
LLQRVNETLSREDATFVSQLIYYSIVDYATPLPDCHYQMQHLIVKYFREMCHCGGPGGPPHPQGKKNAVRD